MWRLQIFIARLRGLFDKNAADSELQQEIDAHLDLLARDFVRQGMSPEDARHAARRQFGGIAQLRQNQLEDRGIPWLEHCARDLRFGLRLLHKDLAFSLIAIGVLALTIGANTAVYSVAKEVVFAPLPFSKPVHGELLN
jgi:hypothetical protein